MVSNARDKKEQNKSESCGSLQKIRKYEIIPYTAPGAMLLHGYYLEGRSGKVSTERKYLSD